jgi:hypothetical protein
MANPIQTAIGRNPLRNPFSAPVVRKAVAQGTRRIALAPRAVQKAAGVYVKQPNNIMTTQRALNKAGFKISVDGLWGPQTQAAFKAYHKGIHPGVFNKTQALANRSAPITPHHKGGAAPRGGGGGGGSGKVPPITSSPGAAPKTPGFNMNANVINPKAYAQAAVNAEFDPQLADLKAQAALGGAQAGQNQADISSWFNQLGQQQSEGAAGSKKAYADAMQAGVSHAGQIASLFGGNNQGDDLANVLQNENSYLTNASATEGSFDDRMSRVFQAAAAEAHLSQKNRDAQSAYLTNEKLNAAQAAKGSAYAKALQDAYGLATTQRGQNIQQQSALQALQLAQGMAPLQVAQAKQNLQVGAIDARSKAQIAKLQARQLQTQISTQKAQLKDFLSGTGGGSGVIPFKKMTIQDQATAQSMVRGAIKDTPMALPTAGRQSRLHTWNIIKSVLPYDFKDPTVRQFGLKIMRSIYPNVKHPELFK